MVKADQLVCLALLVSRCVSLAQPWSRSPYKRSDSTDLHIEKSGVVTHNSGEGLSLSERGVYKVKSRQSRYRSVYRISKDPPEGGTVGADLLDKDVEFVNFRQASQAELVRYMQEKNRALWAVLAEVMNQEPAEYASGKGPLPSPYDQRRRSSTDRQTLIIPVKVLLNFPTSDQTGRSGPSGSSGATRNLWSQAGGTLGWNRWQGGNEGNVKDPQRGLRGGLLWTVDPDTIPIARGGPPDDVRPGTDPRSAPRTNQGGGENRNGNTGTSTSPWADGGRDRGTDLSPGTNQRRNQGINRDPRTNQGRNQATNLDPRTNQGRNKGTSIDLKTNQGTNIDPRTNPQRSQGTNIDPRTNQGRNQGTNIDPRTNQDRSQGTNIDPRTNPRRSQGTSIDLRTNQSRNQGTNIDSRTNSGRSQVTDIDLRTNQGRNQTANIVPRTNPGRNQATSRDPWTNQGRNQGTTIDPWTNQGRNQRTNSDPWTNQTRNSGTNPYPRSNQRRNQGTNTDPQRNQGRYQGTNTDSWTNQTRNRGTNTGPRTNQGRNQRTSTDPWTNQGRNQRTNTDPRTNRTINQGTNTDPWTNQGRNQGTSTDPWTNQGRNLGTNTDPRINQTRNQGTNTDPWANQRRNQGTNTDPWANQARNQGTNTDPSTNQARNLRTNTDPLTNQGRNQGTSTDARTNQTRNQGTHTGPWTNQGRNRGIDTDARINQGRNRESNPDPWRNQGRNQRTSRYSVGNERRIPGTNRYPSANEGGNQRTNRYPSSNQNSNSGTSTYPSASERQTSEISSYPSTNERRNLGINVYLLTNQGTNQGTNTESRANQGRNQEGYTDIRTNQVGNQRTSTDLSGNQTRSSETSRSPWANDGQNGRTNAEPWPNQGRTQWTNSDPSTNPRGLQGTSTDPENDSNVSTETNTDPWVNQGRNPGSIADQTINSNLNSFSSTRQTQATGTSTDRSSGYLRIAGTSTDSDTNQTGNLASNTGRRSNLSRNTVTNTGRRLNRNTVTNTGRRLNRNTQTNTGRRLNRNSSGESGPWPNNSDQNPNAGLRVNPTASSYLPTDQSENQTSSAEEINNRNRNYNDRSPQRYAQTQNDYGKPDIKSASVKLKTQSKNTRKLSRGRNSNSPPQEPSSQTQPQNQNALSPVQNRSRKALPQDEKAEPAPSQNQSQRAQSNYSHPLSQSQSDGPSLTSTQNDTRELNPFGPRGALRQTTPAVPLSTATPNRKSGSPFRPPAEDMRRRHNSYLSHNKPNVRNNSTNTSKNQERNSDLRPSGMQNRRRQHRDKITLKPVISSFDTKPPSRRKRDVGEDARRRSLQPDLWPPGVVSAEAEAAARDHERSLRDSFLLRSSSASSKALPFSTQGLRSPPASSVAGTSFRDVPMTPPQSLHRSASAQSFASSEPYAADVDGIVPVSRSASTGYSSWSPYSPPRSFYKPGSSGGGYRYGGGRGGGGGGGGRWGFRGQVGTGLNSYHAIVKNGVTALLQISNSSSSKGTTSKARGGNADLSGSYFLYDPVTERLSLISGSRTNGVTSQVGTEGSYFEYNPSTEELKLVTNNKELFHFFTNNSNSNSNSNKQNGSTNKNKNKSNNNNNDNNNLKGSYLQYNPSTGELVLKTKSRVNPGKGHRSNPTHPGFQKKTSASPFSPPGNVQVVGVIQVDRQGGTKTPGSTNRNPGYIQFDPKSSQAPNAHAIESIQIVIETDNSNSYGNSYGNSNSNRNSNSNTKSYGSGNKVKNSQNSQDQQIVGFVIVDGGTASVVNPNTDGYVQFNPAGTGTGPVWRGGGGPKRWTSSGWTGGQFYPQRGGHPVPSRPLVRPDPGLFLRMFRVGEIYVEGDAVVQNFYTDGDSKRMMRHFRALPLKSVRARNGFMTGNIKGYHVTACSACGPSRQPMIEFITLYVTSPRLVRRFLYLPRRSGGWVSSSGPYAAPPRHQPRYLGTSPFRNRPQFGIPPFRNQMFDDFSAKRQKRNFARKRRD